MYNTNLYSTYSSIKNDQSLFDQWVGQLSETDMDTVSNWLIEDIEDIVSVVT